MADRIQAVIAVPRDEALPIDVQGVNLRRLALDRMSEVAEVDESSIRYKGGSDSATILLGEKEFMTMWQHNLMAARFFADGKAHKEICGPVVHQDWTLQVHSAVEVSRDEF